MASNCQDYYSAGDCAICLGPLKAASESKQETVLTLHCRHSYHRECIIAQIKADCNKTARNDDQRILFNSFQCALCKSVILADSHPELPRNLFETSDALRSKVDELIKEHGLREEIVKEMSRKDGEQKPGSQDILGREIMRKYAFYRCGECHDPYFGGTTECADSFQPTRADSSGEGGLPQQKLCPSCAPQPQSICRNPSRHASCLTWKCRYCCQPATYLCYGNVHFCNECNDKNLRRNNKHEVAEAIPCPGVSCPHPKPDPNSRFHSNGPTDKCEQVYSCAICSAPDVDDPTRIQPGSRNFVVNPCGNDGLRGWYRCGLWHAWNVEKSPFGTNDGPLFPTPVVRSVESQRQHDRDQPIATNFVSSYYNCKMAQSIDLSQCLRLDRQRTTQTYSPDTFATHNNSNSNSNESIVSPVVRIEVSARYTRRTDYPSLFRMDATLTDGHPFDQLYDFEGESRSTGTLEPDLFWERACLVFEMGTLEDIKRRYRKSPFVTVKIQGEDKSNFAGNCGSKVTDVCVRVLGNTPEEIDALVQDADEPRLPQTNENDADAVAEATLACPGESHGRRLPRTNVQRRRTSLRRRRHRWF